MTYVSISDLRITTSDQCGLVGFEMGRDALVALNDFLRTDANRDDGVAAPSQTTCHSSHIARHGALSLRSSASSAEKDSVVTSAARCISIRLGMKKSTGDTKKESLGESPSKLIDGRIKELGDWRGETLARMRSLIKEADPEVVEEWKWRGVPVWEHSGIICTGETYQKVVKLTFAKGAFLPDPSKLFNSSLEGNLRRAIDIPEGGKVNEAAFKTLIRAAVALNTR
jgi:hypothetical protein